MKVCLLIAAAALANAQSATSSFSTDINGNRVPGTQAVSTDGTTTDLRQSINGREVPISQTEEKVLSKSGNTTVTERIVRHYGANGQVVETERIVTDTTTTADGGSLVHATTFRTDISGNMNEAERKTIDTRKNGNTITTDTSVEKKDLSGSFSIAEKSNKVSEQTAGGKSENETLMLRDANGNLYEAQRSSTTETKKDNSVTDNTAIYQPNASGEFRLIRQEVTNATTNPDGSGSRSVEVFGRPSDGRAYQPDAPPSLTEKRVIDRHKNSDGATIETQTVQVPDVNSPGRLQPAHQVSETICRGECKP